MKTIKHIIVFTALMFLTPLTQAQVSETEQDNQVREKINLYLWDAAREGNLQQIKTLIEGKYDLNVADQKGYTAIILAAYHGHDDALAMLIAAGADPCKTDKRGNSALMGAIFKGEIKVARRLIDAKCQPDQRNNAGQTAAMYASLFQRKELLQALTAKGADMHTMDINGNSPATLAEGNFKYMGSSQNAPLSTEAPSVKNNSAGSKHP